MTYTLDFRRKVLSVREDEGLTISELSARFNIGEATVCRWMNRIEPQQTRNKPATKIDPIALLRDIRQYPDAYQYERAQRLGCSTNGIWHALKRMNITLKKTFKHPKADNAKRQLYQEKINSYREKNINIIYIDESGFAFDMPRTHGYAAKGERCIGLHNWNARGRTNVIGAIIGKIFLTANLYNRTINTDVFHEWVVSKLIPNLPQNSVVVMDNATFHKRSYIQDTITNAGHILEYLPPYSPDFNPIEKKWAQAKKIRRKLLCSVQKLFSFESFYMR